MTITTTRTLEKYVGNGSQNAWPITFPFFKSEDIKACIVNNAGKQVNLTYGTDYTVSVSSGSTGGMLYYTLADGVVLTIWLSLPITQGTDFYNTGPLNAEVLETSLDRLTLIAQQLQEASDRSVKVATSSTETPEQLMASLYAGRDTAVASANTAATFENNALVSKQDAATSETNAATSKQAAASSAITAQAWAESETAPDPNDAESKSAKSWALIASDVVPIATTTSAGKIKASDSLQVDQETGVATVPVATAAAAGIIKASTSLTIASDGTATVPAATESLAGIVMKATDEEVGEEENNNKFITPKQLKDYVTSDQTVEEILDWNTVSVVDRVAWTINTTYTTSCAGVVVVKASHGGTSLAADLYVNGVQIANWAENYTSYNWQQYLSFPVAKGDTILFAMSPGTGSLYFYPCKGAL